MMPGKTTFHAQSRKIDVLPLSYFFNVQKVQNNERSND